MDMPFSDGRLFAEPSASPFSSPEDADLGSTAVLPASWIDVENMVVRDGARATPFAVRAADGTAVLDPAGIALSLRVLRWGEKCAIARFAPVGPVFVDRQVLESCAPGVNQAMAAAVLALLRWLHAPGGRALPFDPVLLARVTARVGSWWRMTPDEVAALPAPDVEALWHALDQAQPEPAETFRMAQDLFDPVRASARRAATSAAFDPSWPRVAPAEPSDEPWPVPSGDDPGSDCGMASKPDNAVPLGKAAGRSRLRERLRFRMPGRQEQRASATGSAPRDTVDPAPVSPPRDADADPASDPQLARLIALVSRDAEAALAGFHPAVPAGEVLDAD